MAEAAFSDDGKYFSAISHDGRLKIWDTETNVLKQEFTPDLHLSSPPTCLQWIVTLKTETPRKGGKKRSASFSEQQNQCIALGTTNGRILIYSVAQAKVVTVLEDEKNSEIQNVGVTSLDWHKKYGLFSSNRGGFVYEWDLSNGVVRNKYNVIFDSKNKQASSVSAIKIVPHNQKTEAKYVVTASWQIRLWRLLDGSADALKTLGHSGTQKPVLSLAFLPNHKTWLIEGSQNERLLSFWDITVTHQLPQANGEAPTKKQRKKSLTEATVSTPEATVLTPTYNFVLEDAPRMVDVSVRQVEVGVKVDLVAVTRSGVAHYYGHMLNGASAKPIKPSVTVQVCTPDAAHLPLQCCRHRGEGLLLGYELAPTRLLFERVIPDLKSKTQVLIRGEAKTEKSKSDESKTKEVTYVEPLGGVVRKRAEPGAKVEVTMESRLANLALDTKSRSKSAVNQNLTRLLVQGLHSRDKSIILTVLQNGDPAVALRTVSQLPAEYVPQLLEQLTDLATKKTNQCLCACVWLSALVRAHAALLLASLPAPRAAAALATLLAVFTQRRSQLCQLLNLKGRLDLTIAQRSTNTTIDENSEAVLTYNDDTSSDEEMAADKYESESDEELWDDEKMEDGSDAADDE